MRYRHCLLKINARFNYIEANTFLMNRRTFGSSILGSALVMGLHSAGPSLKQIGKRTIKPKRLIKGDTIGLIAPASVVSEEKANRAIENIQNLGFKVKEGKYLRTSHGNFAAKDNERLSDLHKMYADPTVKAIWCARGGYGCTRLLPNLDYSLIKKNPKALIGYSDITALLNAIYQKTGIIGFHGPVGSSLQNDFNNQSFEKLLISAATEHTYENFSSDDYLPIEVWNRGSEVAEGRAAGGNLSLMASMVGTKDEIKYKNKIVFIEDIGEAPYRIDRMLTQLLEGSDLRLCKGLVLGQFLNCEAKDFEKELSLEQVLKDRLMPLNVPLIFGMNFGHVDHNITIPVGALVRINADKKEFAVIESVVS